jgi:hypothetical protein
MAQGVWHTDTLHDGTTQILPDYPASIESNRTSMINIRAYSVARLRVSPSRSAKPGHVIAHFSATHRHHRRVRPRPVATETRLVTARIIRCNSQPRHYGLQSSLRCDTP